MASGRNGAENLTCRGTNDIASLAELLLLEAGGRERRLPSRLLLLICCCSPRRNFIALGRSISFPILGANGGGRRARRWEPRIRSFRIVAGGEVGVMAAVLE